MLLNDVVRNMIVTNLVPSLLRLLGQRVVVRRDSGVVKKYTY